MKLKILCSSLAFIFFIGTAVYSDSIIDSIEYKSSPFKKYSTIKIFVKNLGSTQTNVGDIKLNDAGLNDDEGLALWHKIIPKAAISPGETAKITVKLNRDIKGLAKLEIDLKEGETLTKVFPVKESLYKINDVTFSKDREKMYVYISRDSKDVCVPVKVFLNSKELTEKIDYFNAQDMTCLILKPADQFIVGEYISFKIILSKGDILQEVIRVYNDFIISSWDHDDRAELFFDPHPFRVRFDDKGKTHRYSEQTPGKALFFIMDHPNCQDRFDDEALGYNARTLIENEIRASDLAPMRPSFTYICEHAKERAYFAYGGITDILLASPYEIAFHKKTPNENYKYYQKMKLAHEPYPILITPEAFKDAKSDSAGRLPTPQEEELLVVHALSVGAKGIVYFNRNFENNGGYSDSPELESKIGELNANIDLLRDSLAIGSPANLVKLVTPGITATTLLAGDEGMILFAMNNRYVNGFDPERPYFTFKKSEDVDIQMVIPKGFIIDSLSRLAGGNFESYGYELKDDVLNIHLSTLDITEVFFVRFKSWQAQT